jgi:hypothetical protein
MIPPLHNKPDGQAGDSESSSVEHLIPAWDLRGFLQENEDSLGVADFCVQASDVFMLLLINEFSKNDKRKKEGRENVCVVMRSHIRIIFCISSFVNGWGG